MSLRGTFEQVAASYHQARPGYPDALFERLVATTGVGPADRILEVGCGTGKATWPLACRGLRITCVEPGAELAAQARRNLVGYEVEVLNTHFEDAAQHWPSTFALVFAATSWHWVDPLVRYQLAWQVLRPEGYLATWSASHVFPEGGDSFFRDIQDVYDEIGEGKPADRNWPPPGELADARADIEVCGLFELVQVEHFDWEVTYDAGSYIALLDTFSGHIAMETWKRERLYAAIRERLAARPGGRVRRHWGAVLNIACPA